MAKLAVAAAIVVGVCTSFGGSRSNFSQETPDVATPERIESSAPASHIGLRRDFAQTRASRSKPPKPVRPAPVLRPPTRSLMSIRQINDLSGLLRYSDPLPQPWRCIHEHEGAWDSGPHGGDIHYGGFRMGAWEWHRVDGVGLPNQWPLAEQFMRAQMYKRLTSWNVWSTHIYCGV